MNPEQTLAQIAREVADCTQCALHRSRKKSVPGEGSPQTEIMLIGEGPGFYENEQGRPFVGQSGKFLTTLIEQAGMKREEVWIGNVVKCRPPNNRDPLPEELAACDVYLERQIEAIQPSIIITLGRFSMAKFLGSNVRISQIHGQMQQVNGHFVIPMFHPAAALHNPKYRPLILEDFARLPQQLEQARAALKRNVPTQEKNQDQSNPTQLDLF